MSNKKLFFIFLPLLVLAAFALFIRIVQYEPLFPTKTNTDDKTVLQVPIYPEDPITGDKKAPMTLIAFEDFACENCKRESELLATLLKEHPNALKIVWKILPITRYPVDSTLSAQYGYCANQQGKFEAFKSYAFENGDNLSESILQTIATQIKLDTKKLSTCLQSAASAPYLEATKTLAQALHIQTLPTMFINNKQIQAPTNIEGWQTLLGL